MTTLPQQIQDIYTQIGGNRAMAMAFSSWTYSLPGAAGTHPSFTATFQVARNLLPTMRERVTHVVVELLPSDTYRVTLLYCTRNAHREVFSIAGIYAEDLRKLVEDKTGLLLSLGTMRAVAP